MSQFIQPINLEVSPDSLNQGEDAIRQVSEIRAIAHRASNSLF
ncbi:hypothetical protein [Anabaena subtropica]|nr:hypothetical protein [Anabaena subtropica]